jgi:signal transduction histidine kinase
MENALRLEKMNAELQSINNLLFNTNEELNETKDELEVLNTDLEKKVEERTAEIEKLLKQKDDFIGQLSHDLKSPLTPLVGLLPAIENEEKDPKLKELLQVVNRNVLYMRDLVIKTLKLEKLNLPNFKLVFEPFNLYDMVENTIQNKEFYIREKNLDVKINIDKKIMTYGDKLQLDELFDNLLINAIKFTPEKGYIVLDAEENHDFIKISIKDSGIGMTAEEIENVFVEFYKVDPSRHDLESSGLGLPICKRIVEKHGGKIWVESAGHGMGSTFSFTIPKK